VISASATDADTGLPIPPEQIQIGKLGNLDTNGNLYVVLADNDPIVITPMIAGLYNFLFSPVSAIEYPTAITANGIDLSTNTPDFCVGQYIKFDIAGLPRYRGAEAKWALPGTYVNEQPDPNCDLYYDKTNTLLTPRSWKDKTLSTHCWYVLGESNAQVSVTVIYYDSVAEKTISFTFTGKFNVHRPAVVGQLETVDVDGTPTPMISANGNFLTLGANHNEDMSFEHRINSGNFSGDAGYVQLVGFSDAEYSDHVHSHSSLYLGKLDIDISPSNQLDTLPTFVNPDFPRSTTPIPAFDPLFWVLKKGWTDPFYDAPSVYLADNNEVSYQHLHFQTYLMFKPQDSGYGSSIYVPLQQINWKLYDSGQRANQLFDHTAIITSDSGCATFPHWKRAVDLNANQPEQ
jgi:hypothetical protein